MVPFLDGFEAEKAFGRILARFDNILAGSVLMVDCSPGAIANSKFRFLTLPLLPTGLSLSPSNVLLQLPCFLRENCSGRH